MTRFVIVPVEPGTFLRTSPEKHPDGKFVKWTTLMGKETCYEDHPIFEVKSYILDNEGGHVTFQRCAGTFYLLGGGTFVDVKFPYPHAMFEVVGEREAEEIRRSQTQGVIANRSAQRRWKWPDWLRLRAAKLARAHA